MPLVEVDIPLHIFLDVGSYGKLLDLCLFQILLYLFLHLCIHLDLLAVHCTEVPDYTVVAHCCIVGAQCYAIILHYYMEVVPGCTEVQPALSSFMIAPYRYMKFFPSSTPLSYTLYHHDPLI
jgi:hypothetical protein